MFGFLSKKKPLPAPISEFGENLRLNYKKFWDVQSCTPAYLKKSDGLILLHDANTLGFVESAGELMMELAFRIFSALARAADSERPEGFERFVLQLNSFAAMRAVVMTAGSLLTDPEQGEYLQVLVATTIALRLWPDDAARALGESTVTVAAMMKLGSEQSLPFLLRKTAAELKRPLIASEECQSTIAAASQACLQLICDSKLRPIPQPAATLTRLLSQPGV